MPALNSLKCKIDKSQVLLYWMNLVAVVDLGFRGLSIPRNDIICGQDRWMRHFLVGNKLSFGILNKNKNMMSIIM